MGQIAPLTPMEIDSVKARLKETWMAGDYDRISRFMEPGARAFYEQLDIPAGCQLLDVACGSGQLALCAARDGTHVTGVDIHRLLVPYKNGAISDRFIDGLVDTVFGGLESGGRKALVQSDPP